MNFDEYQNRAKSFAMYPDEVELAYLTLGLSGEAGEIANKVKKVFRDGREISREDMKSELGDVLWYVANLAKAYDLSLSEVAESNIDKLQSRADRGKIQGEGDNR
ncbi:MAG: nucleoside triphosphate pyrophosphohydrolase family protein [Candidatus Omnitrophica bacterium]|nr:nucleoside triphosphate pyrophosphohydrolase family protein [Candidatus Omnitrophota bacterium]MCA9435334.1 nucleoside triphosphate pyrophosphohydrolase family protein [Candidatus Omnitrophota bacterium]MCA9441420.1 nucleoside triphosphate pyrophosphohydrolase family protein [Candidatus Omnitrophota bacterium]MCA9445794.1 nucleoside triphosphate pyrophosphohydrolase family protein [Candidatus Omnitrophota bacterium]